MERKERRLFLLRIMKQHCPGELQMQPRSLNPDSPPDEEEAEAVGSTGWRPMPLTIHFQTVWSTVLGCHREGSRVVVTLEVKNDEGWFGIPLCQNSSTSEFRHVWFRYYTSHLFAMFLEF